MKILRIVYDFPPPWGGLSPFPWEITKAQIESGNDVTVICGLWKNATPPLPKISSHLKLIRIMREPFRASMLYTTAILAFFIILKETLTKRYDYIIGHGHLPIYYHLFRYLTPFLKHSPYYLLLHITASGRARNADLMKEHVELRTRLEWFLHKTSDSLGVKVAKHIFVTGENIKQEAIHYYHVSENKITVLENGVDTKIFTPQGKNMRKTYHLHNNDKVILFVGTHNNRKGIERLINMLIKLPKNYKLLTVGGGKSHYFDELLELCKRNNVVDRVIFAGAKAYPIPEYFRTANVFVLLSHYEGFPKVVLEALSCGIPVIASGFSVLDPPYGLHILTDKRDFALADLVMNLCSKKEGSDPKEIEKRYSWKAMAEKIEDVINQ